MTATIEQNNTYAKLFEAQKHNATQVSKTTASQRIAKIKAIKDWTFANEERICSAIYKDFKKSVPEAKISEILPVVSEARHIISNLRSWMRPEAIDVPLRLLGTTGKVVHEAKGNCLIISPWNYPYNLTLKPLLQAVAAGNVVIIKPSEMTPNSSALLKEMMAELFDENEVAVVEGDAETAMELQELPFNHIFFTGSPAVGKHVMAAAAKHLASVTLELGGKCPAIVDETANIKDAATKLVFGKYLNNGQTCIAPDYVLIHESKKDELVTEMSNQIQSLYGNEIKNNPDYCRVVNNRHHTRLTAWLHDAVEKGAKVEIGGESDASQDYFSPTVVSNVSEDMTLMQQEIFGPILPIKTYQNLDEAVGYINENEKPLALYLFSKSSKNKKNIDASTSSGAFVINDIAIHYLIDDSPFGGVNNSGIGKSFGKYGYIEFSNIKPVVENKFSQTSLFHPPYTKKLDVLLNLVAKWF